jgi:hypothetical protein
MQRTEPTPVQRLAALADDLCDLAPEDIVSRLDDLMSGVELEDMRAAASAAVVVMIHQMADKLEVQQSCEFIRQIVIPSMVWIWNEPPKSISSALGILETLGELTWLRPGSTITVPEDFATVTYENTALMARVAVAVSARGAGVFGDALYGDRLRTL